MGLSGYALLLLLTVTQNDRQVLSLHVDSETVNLAQDEPLRVTEYWPLLGGTPAAPLSNVSFAVRYTTTLTEWETGRNLAKIVQFPW